MKYSTCLLTIFIVYIQRCLSLPVTIDENNWDSILEGEWMVEFMAPWCPACRGFTATWNKFSDWSKDLDIKVGVVDVTENPGLSGRFLVGALPTIYHIKDGQFRQYKSSRKENDLISFVDEKKWQNIEPIPWYISPVSIQMKAVGTFFKLAMKIRWPDSLSYWTKRLAHFMINIYTMMTKEYGIPEWACYVIFAILTIVTGLVLGLMIVCCCDLVFPSKMPPPLPVRRQTDPAKGEPNNPQKAEDNDDSDDESDILDDTKPSEEDNTTNNKPRKRNIRKAE